MKLRTINHFSNFLDQELAWRKMEISSIHATIIQNHNKDVKQNSIIRAATAMLYAHWEGFVKTASVAYIEFICNQGLNYESLSVIYKSLGIRSKLNNVLHTEENKVNGLIDLVDFILNHQHEKFHLDPMKVIDTKSNLNSRVFRDIVTCLGIDYSQYQTKEKFIDGTLLYYRNNIAHGRVLLPTIDVYIQMKDGCIFLIDRYKTDLENASILRIYASDINAKNNAN